MPRFRRYKMQKMQQGYGRKSREFLEDFVEEDLPKNILTVRKGKPGHFVDEIRLKI